MRSQESKIATRPVFLVCHGCGTRGHSADRYCRRCGLDLLRAEVPDQPAEPPPEQPHGSRPPGRGGVWRGLRLGARPILAVAALGLLVASATTTVRGRGAADVAGVHIGDDTARVERLLGKPARSPIRLAWKPHHEVLMWQYDLDREAGGVPNLSVTFVDGHVWRVASLHRRYGTGEGLRVGDTLEKARSLYGTGIEEDADTGLVPWKFICGDEVVKVIVPEDGSELLAVGVETPLNFKLMTPPPWHGEPQGDFGGPSPHGHVL